MIKILLISIITLVLFVGCHSYHGAVVVSPEIRIHDVHSYYNHSFYSNHNYKYYKHPRYKRYYKHNRRNRH